jgi:ankyrin repeat protein
MCALLATTESVVRITSRCRIYENLYLSQTINAQQSDVQANLDSALVDIYKAALDVLAESMGLFTGGATRRTYEVIVRPSKASDNLSALGDKEAEIINDVRVCEVMRSSESDQRVEKMLGALEAPMARVDEGVSKLLKQTNKSDRIALLEWISPILFGKHHDTVKDARTPSTGEWLLNHKDFRDWEDKRSSALFWLQGNPGSGKTFLTSAAIDRIRDQICGNDEGFAFFYCKRDDPPRDQPLAVLQSFVRQLSTTASHPESMQIELQQSCERARENGTNFRLEQCKQHILKSLNIYPRTTLFIDAVDECEPGLRYELIQALKMFMSESRRVVRIFISSRPDPKIQYQLKSSPNIGIRAEDSQEDIQKFLNTELDKLAQSEPLFESLKLEIITKLLERCQGMFQWANLQVHQIAKCESPLDVYTRLEKLPKDLKDAYDEVWRQIEDQEKHGQASVKSALRWVIAASEPMTSEELLAAVRANPNGDLTCMRNAFDEQRLLSLCNNFLVVDPQLKVWRFPHLSVREYLEAKEDWSLPHAHYHAASVCLAYFVNKYEHDDTDFDTKLAPDVVKKSVLDAMTPIPAQSDEGFHTLHPFHIYMRHNWAYHVNGAEDIEMTKLGHLLKSFLGSPNESSVQYRRWHQKNCIDFQENLPIAHPKHFLELPGSLDKFEQTKPADAALFGMCTFSLDSILRDWWEDMEIDIPRIGELLSISAGEGCLPICENLLQRLPGQPPDPDSEGEYFGSSLWQASNAGHIEIVQMLLDHGAYAHGNSLVVAARRGREDIVQLLLDRGADVNSRVRDRAGYRTALTTAAIAGQEKTVQILLGRGADVNPKESPVNGDPLSCAISSGNEEIVRMLLENGADVNAERRGFRENGDTLRRALSKGNEHIVRMLLNHGAIVSDDGNETALNAAFLGGNANLVQMLLDQGTILSNERMDFALDAALKGGNENLLQMLLDLGANIDEGAALHAAVKYGSGRIVRFLLDRGADANTRDQHKITALHYAVSGGYEEILQILLDRGADINARGFSNFTVIGSAMADGNPSMVQMLLDLGADLDDGQGGEMIRYMAGRGNWLAQVLRDHGVDDDFKLGAKKVDST